MKKIVLPFILVVLLTVACGSAVSSVTPTSAPAQTTAATNNGTEVDIKLADNTIASSVTTFKVGVPYTFNIHNTGHHTHLFDISTPVSVAGSLDTALSSALLSVDRSQLPAGANISVNFTFPDSAAGQKLEFACLIKMHYEDGMYLAITVTK